MKFIPLTNDGSVWLSLGGGRPASQGEYFRHYLFGASKPEDTDAYLLSRFRLSADLHVTPYFRMFAEGKSSMALDRDLQGGRTTAYVNEVDLRNGFLDVMIPLGDLASVTLRGGRRELIFGSQRLVGPGDFTQVPHTFDGAAAFVRIGDWTVTPFWTMAVPVINKYSFNDSTLDQQLFGIFGTGPLHLLPGNLDLCWLGVNNAVATFNGTSGREQRQTLGGRTWARSARPTRTSRWRERASWDRWGPGQRLSVWGDSVYVLNKEGPLERAAFNKLGGGLSSPPWIT